MNVRKPLFHVACLSLAAIGVWQLLTDDRLLGLLCLGFFGGGWLAVVTAMAAESGRVPARVAGVIAGLGALGMAAACGFAAVQAWGAQTLGGFVLVMAGAAGALLFGAGGLNLIVQSALGRTDVLRRLTPPPDPES